MNKSECKMKHISSQFIILLVFAWFLFVARVLFAQPEILLENLNESLQSELVAEPDSSATDTILINNSGDNRPYLGIVFGRDLDFETAGELHYPYSYGAYIDGIDEDGPADRAGLRSGDIITRFGNNKILYNDQFVRTVANYHPGDKIPVIIYRDQKIMKTTVTLEALKAEQHIELDEPDYTVELNFPSKKKTHLISGSGVGVMSWDFIFYAPDNTELYDNFLNTALGYSTLLDERQINNKNYSGLNMNGFYLKPGDQDRSVDMGFFWANNHWNRQKPVVYENTEYNRRMTYSVDYWGITLDKQVTIFNHVILSGGVLAGMLSSSLDFYQGDPIESWGDISTKLTNRDNNYLSVNKKYFLVQPNIAMMVPVLGDLGIQLKIGYFYGIPRSDDWKVNSLNGDDSIINSPNTSIGGYTFSFGPALILR